MLLGEKTWPLYSSQLIAGESVPSVRSSSPPKPRFREGYITVEGNAGDRNDLSAWHNGVRGSFIFKASKLINVVRML